MVVAWFVACALGVLGLFAIRLFICLGCYFVVVWRLVV